ILVVADAEAAQHRGLVQGGEDDEHQDREREREHRARGTAPVELLLVPELASEECDGAHGASASRPTSSRYTSSSERRATVRPARSTPRSSAQLVRTCSARVGSTVST